MILRTKGNSLQTAFENWYQTNFTRASTTFRLLTFDTDLGGNVDDVCVVFEGSFALGEGDHVLHHSRHFFGDENQIIARVFESIHLVDQLGLLFVEIVHLKRG